MSRFDQRVSRIARQVRPLPHRPASIFLTIDAIPTIVVIRRGRFGLLGKLFGLGCNARFGWECLVNRFRVNRHQEMVATGETSDRFLGQKFTARFTKLLVLLGVSSMRRLIITLTVVVCAAISSSNASAGLFHKKSDCCDSAPVCCEAPAPAPAACCDATPACRPKLHLGHKMKGIMSHLHSKFQKDSCCDTAPSCGCEAPAPAPCAAPAPAPSCGCDAAPISCKPARKHCLQDAFSHIKGKFASKRSSATAPSCGCEAPAPSCGCN